MKSMSMLLRLIAVLLCADLAHADRPVVLTRDTKTVVDLIGTDLVKKKDLLDCSLRLEGKPPNYKIVYSLGEIPVPTKAVKTMHDDVFVSIAIKARIGGMPANRFLIPYNKSERPYRAMNSDIRWGKTANYTIGVQKPERFVLNVLRERYGMDRVVDRSQFSDLAPGAVLVRSHAEPELFLFGMDGLGGAKEKNRTQIYYVCLADR